MAIVPEEVRKEDVTKLLEILVRSYSMKMQAKRTDEKEIPDFLWIIAEESKDAAYIEKELMKEKENLSDVKVHYYGMRKHSNKTPPYILTHIIRLVKCDLYRIFFTAASTGSF